MVCWNDETVNISGGRDLKKSQAYTAQFGANGRKKVSQMNFSSTFAHGWMTRWWKIFQIFFGIFTPKIGEDEPNFDEHIFEMGWFNHQLDELLCLIWNIKSTDQ